LRSASRIIPAVNRLFWIDYDFQWHPESCLSQVSGFKTILDFIKASPMPGVGVMSLSEYAITEADADKGAVRKKAYGETPLEILELLRDASAETERIAGLLEAGLGELCGGHAECTLYDLKAYVEMGRYYRCKLTAALALNRYKLRSLPQHRADAVEALEQAARHWERLGYYWSLHNTPYFMARVKRTFGYPLYTKDVLADIELARRYEPK
jgi:hypothetical protein